MRRTFEKFSSQMDERVLAELRDYAKQSSQPISAILTDAVSSHLERVRIRPGVRRAVEEVMDENSELLARLAK